MIGFAIGYGLGFLSFVALGAVVALGLHSLLKRYMGG